MKIISYNVNGIRSVINKGFVNWINKNNPDIICLQEIKAYSNQINTSIFDHIGYNHYWHSSKRKGYSGVGILTKEKPINIKYGIDIDIIDKEGRILRIDLKNSKISVISVYIPSGSYIKNRLEFKFFFMDKFFSHIKKINKKIKNLIICGDYNICHNDIDIYNPNEKISGFLPDERIWIDNFIYKLSFIDSFRNYTKSGGHYSWWNYRYNCRNNNKGWRIDYIMVSKFLKKRMKNSYMLSNIKYSDHCPIVLEID
ncbi:exodeoxyribonuclease III [Blattabacterium cuenoti]|uniref:exodeoxyribonuclease III n=1 Tax=Blattabacterium cuenoti TaxID=1653831 RepID=UPI00163CF28F|nr:exodeoxyribonuclease III [Blattabacterium cuenoti]